MVVCCAAAAIVTAKYVAVIYWMMCTNSRNNFTAGVADNMRAGEMRTNAAGSAAEETEAALKRMQGGEGIAMISSTLDESEELELSMPPLLLVAADMFYEVGSAGALPMPLASEAWSASTADIAVLMARLWLLHTVFKQPTVRLSQLLGGVDVGTHEVVLRVPTSGLVLGHIRWQMERADFEIVARRVDTSWAYLRLKNADIDSWLFLRSEPTGQIVFIQLQRMRQQHARALSADHAEPRARRMVWVRGLQHVLLVVTDQRKPVRRSSWMRLLSVSGPGHEPAILVTPELHKLFYSGCRNLLLSALAEG